MTSIGRAKRDRARPTAVLGESAGGGRPPVNGGFRVLPLNFFKSQMPVAEF